MTQRFKANFYQPSTLLAQACEQAIAEQNSMADQIHRLAGRFDHQLSAHDRSLLFSAIHVLERGASVMGALLARNDEDGNGF